MESETRTKRREQLLQAATEEFCEFGYERAKMEGIARRAGMGKSTVYEYFPSKAELLNETGEFVLAQIMGDVDAIFNSELPMRAKLTEYLEYISGVVGYIGPSFLHIVGNAPVAEIVRQLAGKYLDYISERLREMLTSAQETGEISPDVNIETAASLIATMPNPPFVRLVEPKRLRPSIERLVDLLFDGLLPRN